MVIYFNIWITSILLSKFNNKISVVTRKELTNVQAYLKNEAAQKNIKDNNPYLPTMLVSPTYQEPNIGLVWPD